MVTDMKTWKKPLALIIAALMLFTLASCEGTKKPNPDIGSSAGEDLTEVDWLWYEDMLPAETEDTPSEPTDSSKAPQRPAASASSAQSNAIPSEFNIITEKQEVDILRTEDKFVSRLVYLKIYNIEGLTYNGCTLTYTDGGKAVTRELATIYPNNVVVYDTIWVRSDTSSIKAVMKGSNGKEIWKGTIKIQKAARESVVPKSKIYHISDLTTMSLRGTNYYPRYAPWTTYEEGEPYWEKEFADFVPRLHVNTLRIMLEVSTRKSGNLPPPETIERLNKLLAVANKYNLKIMVCAGAGQPSRLDSENLRWLRGVMEPFMNDGRILLWDMINEVDAALEAQPYIVPYLQKFFPMLKQFDPNHDTHIGWAYFFDRITALNLNQPIWQYHYYGIFNVDVMDETEKKHFPGRPYIIGEFGYTSLEYISGSGQFSSEEYQATVYKSIFEGAMELKNRGHKIMGVYNWCAYEYPGFYTNENGEGYNGVIREDGTLKPAGAYLAGEYLKLKQSNPAPWER